MPRWREDFGLVVDASIALQIELVCVPVVPSLILMAGAFMLGGSAGPEPHAGIVGAVREAAFYFYIVAALTTLLSCIKMAAKEYRRIHKRLFG